MAEPVGPSRWRISPRFRHQYWSYAVCGRQLPEEWIKEMADKKPPSGPKSPSSPGRPPGGTGPDKNPPMPPNPPGGGR